MPTSAATEADPTESLDALIDLHTRSTDSARGFQKMVEKAEPGFRPVAERFLALHERHVARLDNMIREMGSLPDEGGSFMGTINRTVVAVRAAVDAIDKDVTAQIASGEKHVLSAFDRAIKASLPQAHLQALIQMQAELTSLIADMRRAV